MIYIKANCDIPINEGGCGHHLVIVLIDESAKTGMHRWVCPRCGKKNNLAVSVVLNET